MASGITVYYLFLFRAVAKVTLIQIHIGSSETTTGGKRLEKKKEKKKCIKNM